MVYFFPVFPRHRFKWYVVTIVLSLCCHMKHRKKDDNKSTRLIRPSVASIMKRQPTWLLHLQAALWGDGDIEQDQFDAILCQSAHPLDEKLRLQLRQAITDVLSPQPSEIINPSSTTT